MRCKYCKFDRPIEMFRIIQHPRGNYQRLKCNNCINAEQRKLRRKRTAAHWRNQDLKRNYGITLSEYEQMVVRQNRVCAICEQDPTEVGDKLCVDHDHNTGRIRGLLCRHCNRAIGMIQDNPQWASNMVKYLSGNWITKLVSIPWPDSGETLNSNLE